MYTPDETQAVLNATTKFFQENQDPKAQIITTLVGSLIGTSTIVIFFYDGPTAPASFAQFEKITPLTLLPNVRSQGFSSFVSGIPSQAVFNPRGTFNTMSTSGLTVGFVDAVKREVDVLELRNDDLSRTLANSLAEVRISHVAPWRFTDTV